MILPASMNKKMRWIVVNDRYGRTRDTRDQFNGTGVRIAPTMRDYGIRALPFVYDGDSGEKIAKIFVLMLQSGEVLGERGLFKMMADRTNVVKPISAAVTLHTVAQKTDGAKVSLLEAGFNCL
jgi:hypothetical protein